MTAKIDGKELKKIISICWDAAGNAQLDGVAEKMWKANPSADSRTDLNEVRWEIFRVLLMQSIPSITVMQSTGEMSIKDTPEDWKS